MGLLKNQAKKQEPEEDKASSWSVVQDDYMMGAKLKDFDKNDDVANEDEEVWNAAHEQLDSDNDEKKKKHEKHAGKKPVKKGGKGGANHKGKKQRTR